MDTAIAAAISAATASAATASAAATSTHLTAEAAYPELFSYSSVF